MSIDPATAEAPGAVASRSERGAEGPVGPPVPAAERVELSMPVSPELFALTRMLVSVVASRLGFDYEDVCDLRLAVDELVTLCTAGHTDDARITLWSSSDDRALRIDCAVSPVGAQEVELAAGEEPEHAWIAGMHPSQLSERILEVLVDAHGSQQEAGSNLRTGWLWKLRPSS